MIQSLHKLVYEPAPLIKDLTPEAPADLQRIVRRCLAKDPESRYQSIKEVAIELKELRRDLETSKESGPVTSTSISSGPQTTSSSRDSLGSTLKTIAVLPFKISQVILSRNFSPTESRKRLSTLWHKSPGFESRDAVRRFPSKDAAKICATWVQVKRCKHP